MGPTASGKTEFAVRLAKRFPFDLISVDSALVYRGMDIGTAKPDPQLQERVPHRLIDIREPEDSYSAGDFVRDAESEIERSLNAGRLPLLVGGTMMYFRALTEGIAELPEADPETRAALDEEAARRGWPALHQQLLQVDPQSARRISQNDAQRIQRALEVYRVSGRSLSDWQAAAAGPERPYRYLKIALIPDSRKALHQRIADRLCAMFAGGLVEEVRGLRLRPGLTGQSPAMRAVGYRQVWQHLDGDYDLAEAEQRALYATRQLAKRQLTWLRGEKALNAVDPLEDGAFGAILSVLGGWVDKNRSIGGNLL